MSAPLNPVRHKGRVHVVTGGGSGMGKATAIQLAAEGARVAVADVRAAIAEETAHAISQAGGEAIAITCDISREADVANLVAATVKAFGGVDGLFANAGTAGRGWIHETTLEDWERVIGVNLTGHFLCAKHVLPHVIARGGGCIVTTGSAASLIIAMGGSAASYAASKGGLLQLTRQIAVDYGPQGVRAICICPGGVRTHMGKHATEDRQGQSTPTGEPLPRVPIGWPMGRVGEPEEIAATVSFLLSDEASFITGIALPIDGGYTAI